MHVPSMWHWTQTSATQAGRTSNFIRVTERDHSLICDQRNLWPSGRESLAAVARNSHVEWIQSGGLVQVDRILMGPMVSTTASSAIDSIGPWVAFPHLFTLVPWTGLDWTGLVGQILHVSEATTTPRGVCVFACSLSLSLFMCFCLSVCLSLFCADVRKRERECNWPHTNTPF